MSYIIENWPEWIVKISAMILWPFVVLAVCVLAVVAVLLTVSAFFYLPFADLNDIHDKETEEAV